MFQPSDSAPFGSNMEAQALAVKRKLDYYRQRPDIGEVVCLWECEFDKMLKEDQGLMRFLTHLPYPTERLRIRTGLRGGRTETFRMIYTGEKGRKMYYIDKVSSRVYLFVNKINIALCFLYYRTVFTLQRA